MVSLIKTGCNQKFITRPSAIYKNKKIICSSQYEQNYKKKKNSLTLGNHARWGFGRTVLI